MAADGPLQDKTLVAWVAPASLTQRGDGTLHTGRPRRSLRRHRLRRTRPGQVDGGERVYRRTMRNQESWPRRNGHASPSSCRSPSPTGAGRSRPIMTGAEYSRRAKSPTRLSRSDRERSSLIGPRHIGNRQFFAGAHRRRPHLRRRPDGAGNHCPAAGHEWRSRAVGVVEFR